MNSDCSMADIFDFGPERLLYAVMGNPVAHSKSPLVHSLFAKQFDIHLEYRALYVEIGGFEQAVSGFQARGGRGLNVTLPFKANAWKLADEISERARQARAVNTLALNERIFGDNTDGIGLVTDIETNLHSQFHESTVLVIGAGGAVRGTLGPILECRPALVTVANRTKDKAVALASAFSEYGNVIGCGLEEVGETDFELVINATSTELTRELPQVSENIFRTTKLAYDMMYASKPTRFLTWAKDCGAVQIADGLGMLIEQAAESFQIWHGRRPDTAPVFEVVRSGMQR